MKVLHTLPGLRLTAGGPPLSVSLTVLGLRDLDVDAEILTYGLNSAADKNIIESDFIHFLPSPKERRFVYSPHFNKWLEMSPPYDIYHCQGVWQYPSFALARFARKLNKPYVVTPRGMLYPQIFKNNPFAKKFLWHVFLKKDIQKASCIHVTCVEEMQHLRAKGIRSPMAVISNPVDVESFLQIQIEEKDNKFRVGYLGRIDSRKNIDRLIYAWMELGDLVQNGELLIMGAGDAAHHEFLKEEVRRLGLKNVVFTGFLSGERKTDAISSLSYLVVPSDFENFGMIVAEALMHRVPVIASTGTPWGELISHECGWWIKNDTASIKTALLSSLSVPEKRRKEMGVNGQNLVIQNYSRDVIAKKVKLLYEWLIGEAKKPDFVYTD